MIIINKRPSVEMEDGYLSDHNASVTPIIYEMESTKFPINTFDTTFSLASYSYSSAKKGMICTVLAGHGYLRLDYVYLTSTGSEDSDKKFFKIKEVMSSTQFVIDHKDQSPDLNGAGFCVRYYNNYKGVVKVYNGLPEDHPLTEGSVLKRTVNVIFNPDNIGLLNIKNSVVSNLNADYKEGNNTNLREGFTISYAESYDVSNSSEVNTFTSEFIEDTLSDVTVFNGFNNTSFQYGLDEWLQVTSGDSPEYNFGGSTSGQILWSSPNNALNQYSPILYQNIDLLAGDAIRININGEVLSAVNSFKLTWMYFDGAVWTDFGFNIIPTGVFNIDSATILTANLSAIGLKIEHDDTIPTGGSLAAYLYDFVINPFKGLEDPNFEDGITEYSQEPNGIVTPTVWTSKAGGGVEAIFDDALMVESDDTNILHQEIDLFANVTYDVEVDYDVEVLDPTGVELTLEVMGQNNGNSWVALDTVTPINAGKGTCSCTFNSATFYKSIGFKFQVVSLSSGDKYEISVSRFQVKTENTKYQAAVGYAVYGARQFQNYIGGNFGDHIMRVTDTGFYNLPKNLTDFEELRFFYGSPLYVSALLRDYGQATVQISLKVFDYLGVEIDEMITPVVDEGSGVYNNSLDVSAWMDLQGIGIGDWRTAALQYQILDPNVTEVGEVITVNNTTDCINPRGISLRWLNNKGGFEHWYFNNDPINKEIVSSIEEVEYDIMDSMDGSFITGETQFSATRVNARPEIEVNSGWLSESEFKELNRINRSIRVQYQDKNSLLWQTVSLKAGSFVTYDRGEPQREVKVKFKLPEILTQGQ